MAQTDYMVRGQQPERRELAMTITRAFAVFLAIAVFAGGFARAQDGEHTHTNLFGDIGDNCANGVKDDVFDGKIAAAGCSDLATHFIAIGARCKNNTTDLAVLTPKHISEDGLHLWTALDGAETPEWKFRLVKTNNTRELYIRPAIPTVKELLKHSRLQISIVESNGERHNADIDISRFGEALAPVRELCGW